MIENGLYLISDSYFLRFSENGSVFKYNKSQNRPTFCCFKDYSHEQIYWAIPLSKITQDKIDTGAIARVKGYINSPEGSLRWAFYHIARTNEPVVFNISSAFPVIDKYVDHEWQLNGKHFIVPVTSNIQIIKKKLRRILSEERREPNKFEQRITDIKTILISEITPGK
jgi:hypothetical protein